LGGRIDQLGDLLRSVKGLEIFDLEQARDAQTPIHPVHVPPGYQYLLHRSHLRRSPEPRTGAAGVLTTSDHAGTHIDALCHQAFNSILHGDRPAAELETPFGFGELGADTIEPIVARGLLVDLVRHTGARIAGGRWITLAEVQDAAGDQGIEPGRGDVVLIRTGAGALWRKADEYMQASGMAREVSEWLAALEVRAVGADNVAWDWPTEKDPDTHVTLPGHITLLIRSGIHIVENLFLEELGDAGVREFLFVCLPLKLQGATASPVRPIAIGTRAA
jgi:kynurenine formamidase